MEVIDDVFAPRLSDVSEARRETELQPHHRKAGIAERDRELGPETARGWQHPHQQHEQRGENEQKIDRNPDYPPYRVAKAHKFYLPSAPRRPRSDHVSLHYVRPTRGTSTRETESGTPSTVLGRAAHLIAAGRLPSSGPLHLLCEEDDSEGRTYARQAAHLRATNIVTAVFLCQPDLLLTIMRVGSHAEAV